MNRNFTAICAALLMCAILIVFCCAPVIGRVSVSFAESEEKVIYLTFDDGPSDRVTPRILDVLKEENVKATFFIIGKNAEQREYLIRRELDEGHVVAVHSYSHNYKEIYSSPQALVNDIDKCNSVICEVAGKPSVVYRFPGGSYGLSSALINAVIEHGMRYIDWNASIRDAELVNPSPDDLYKAAISTPANRDNIVMLAHDSTTKSTTADALKNIIKYYKEQGYTFKTF